MATIVSVDEFVTDEWYPGFKPAFEHAPYYVEPFRTFNKEDEKRFWFLDFHWPRGLTPLGLIWNEDGYNWGTQFAAENLPLPPGRGLVSRIAGIHTYASPIDVQSPYEIGERAQRMGPRLGEFLANFDEIWASRRDEVERGWQHFVAMDPANMSLPELSTMLKEARAYHKRAFEIHFEIMYPLLVNYLGFYGMCAEMGLDVSQIGKFLQGYDTKIMETDRELWKLTRAAKQAGLAEVFATTPASELASKLDAMGGAGSAWMTQFRDFLQVYGYRTEGSCDVALPSWNEDPTPALGTIQSFIAKEEEHDFEKALAAAIEERETAIDEARSKLTAEEQTAFDAGVASCQAANFPWWQDDHNYYIDLKVSLPMRWAARAIAEKTGADQPDDGLFLFWPELTAVADGEKSMDSLKSIVKARHDYFDYWHERRPSMPKVLGTIPEAVTDPVLIEIFGLNQHFLTAIQAAGSDSDVKTLTGVPASKGKARGRARVFNNADNLHTLEPGDILVCESTSPNWTPAFAKIAGCVCDGGGMLSHAAIVGREYGVPTVTAVGLGTVVIAEGDEVEVDGDTGTVTVIKKA
ncbi:MAG: PEP-utilizing enzyme [Candidatus Nanopelagicales bacterium]|jgi:phosphohistidine swiveling domain-containing protein|nr:PEP-utilizing enzyme [Candidatus Nanopelagicales bacterium]MDP4715915.1 PEP-utilizing enzyme [Candidatus Nanopelagicales bacterium]MDP4906939.1 PEP-utilizing enzyme [Candidatus Nanopelagicales bacterium]MDP4974295.1 PEP-utilizing enzyme [Candidatus Nanopelagicales bacterium]MDP5095050.1 PEP-utilizing enzyme [Candidatus Nanopelagicales bacterium]